MKLNKSSSVRKRPEMEMCFSFGHLSIGKISRRGMRCSALSSWNSWCAWKEKCSRPTAHSKALLSKPLLYPRHPVTSMSATAKARSIREKPFLE